MANPFDRDPSRPTTPGQYGAPPPNSQPGPTGFPQHPQNTPGHIARPKKKARWPWVLLGGFVVLLLAVGSCSFFAFGALTAPIGASNDYTQLIEDGEFDEAYASLCGFTKATNSFEQWKATADLGQITDYDFKQSQIVNSSAEVTGTVTVDGVKRPASYNLQREDGDWKVCTVSIS